MKILLGDRDIPPMRLTLSSSGEGEIAGGLPTGCAAKFRKFLDAAPDMCVLWVNNDGGRIREARSIAAMVGARRLTTRVSTECSSAATIIFLSGLERHVCKGARMGFHACHFPGIGGRAANAAARTAMISAGVAPAFADRVAGVSHLQMWYPSTDELLSAGVATGVTSVPLGQAR